jgi:hypothetical protein
LVKAGLGQWKNQCARRGAILGHLKLEATPIYACHQNQRENLPRIISSSARQLTFVSHQRHTAQVSIQAFIRIGQHASPPP